MPIIKEQLQKLIKQSMIAKEKEKLEVLRLISSEIKQIEVDERIDIDDARILEILAKMTKKRKDAMETFVQGGRQDLVDQEAFEVKIISLFLPKPMSEDEVKEILSEVIHKTGAKSLKDMGQVMAEVKISCNGRFDMSRLSAIVKSSLT